MDGKLCHLVNKIWFFWCENYGKNLGWFLDQPGGHRKILWIDSDNSITQLSYEWDSKFATYFFVIGESHEVKGKEVFE